MPNIRSTWNIIKNLIDEGHITVSYIEADGNYYIFSSIRPSGYSLICVLGLVSTDGIDFRDNYKDSSTSII